ncbi:hypothetical protein DFH09DRAFT_1366492, partial [Mycena vulgaris]
HPPCPLLAQRSPAAVSPSRQSPSPAKTQSQAPFACPVLLICTCAAPHFCPSLERCVACFAACGFLLQLPVLRHTYAACGAPLSCLFADLKFPQALHDECRRPS